MKSEKQQITNHKQQQQQQQNQIDFLRPESRSQKNSETIINSTKTKTIYRVNTYRKNIYSGQFEITTKYSEKENHLQKRYCNLTHSVNRTIWDKKKTPILYIQFYIQHTHTHTLSYIEIRLKQQKTIQEKRENLTFIYSTTIWYTLNYVRWFSFEEEKNQTCDGS